MYDTTAVDGWFNQTTLHPIAVMALLVVGVATLLVPRRYALVPMLILACFVAPAQRIVIATLDFNFLRMMVLLGWVRIVLRGEMEGWRWKPIDTVIVLWALCAAAVGTLLHTTPAALINRLGLLYDAVGLYFLCRFLVRDWKDVRVFAQSVALISVPVAIAFLVEKTTGRNLFAVFGGVPEITTVRSGRLRCQGPFSHPILGGSFWAVLMPLIGALWWCRGRNRILAIVGLCGSMVMVITCASATPIGGVLAGMVAAALFPLRRWMGWVRLSAVVAVIGLQLVMVNPVWHLLARTNLVAGSTGWYRFKLMDEFFSHFDDWWLIGTDSYSTWWGGGFAAITNEYVLQGISGGLLTLVLFLGMIAVAFHGVGLMCRWASQRHYRLVRATRDTSSVEQRQLERVRRSPGQPAMVWALGVSLFIHCVMFISVSYFGQVILVWYLTLGFIGSLTPLSRRRRAVFARLWRSTPPGARTALPGAVAPAGGT